MTPRLRYLHRITVVQRDGRDSNPILKDRFLFGTSMYLFGYVWNNAPQNASLGIQSRNIGRPHARTQREQSTFGT